MDDLQLVRLDHQLRSIARHYALWLDLAATDQEDFVQECLWQAFRKGEAFLETLLERPDAREQMRRFVHSVAANFQRTQKRRQRRESLFVDLPPTGLSSQPPDFIAPISFEEGIICRVDLQYALDGLSVRQRKLLCLYYLDGEDYARLAKRCHTTEHAVRQRLYYIKKKLAAWWESREKGSD